MGRNCQQIHAERPDVDGDLAGRLDGVGMEERSTGVGERRDLGDWLNRAYLVIGVHDRYKGSAVGEGVGDTVRGHHAGLVDRHQGGLPPPAGQGLQGVQNGLVLDGAGHQVLSAGRLEDLGGPSKGQVVGLRAAAREDDLGRVSADQCGRRGTGLVDHRLGLLAEVVEARCVAEDVPADPGDGLDGLRGHGGRRVVVKVDTHGETFILASGANSRKRKD